MPKNSITFAPANGIFRVCILQIYVSRKAVDWNEHNAQKLCDIRANSRVFRVGRKPRPFCIKSMRLFPHAFVRYDSAYNLRKVLSSSVFHYPLMRIICDCVHPSAAFVLFSALISCVHIFIIYCCSYGNTYPQVCKSFHKIVRYLLFAYISIGYNHQYHKQEIRKTNNCRVWLGVLCMGF